MPTTKRTGRPVLVLAALFGLFGLVGPEDAMALRCDGNLVDEGDPAYQVRSVCGVPDYVLPLYGPGNHRAYPREELWYYNFGPNRLIRELRVRDGRLQTIRTPGRGFRERERVGGCKPTDIATGMTGYEVIVQCGEPVQQESRGMLRRRHRDGIDYGHRRAWVEDWYYRFGDRHIDRRVRLIDGRVRAVDTVD